jgi:hypothetical protein
MGRSSMGRAIGNIRRAFHPPLSGLLHAHISKCANAVMAGLVPAIHAKPRRYLRKAPAFHGLLIRVWGAIVCRSVVLGCDDVLKSIALLANSAWMAGTSPAKTASWKCVTPSAQRESVAAEKPVGSPHPTSP